MSKQAERNTAVFRAVYDAVQTGAKLKDAIAAAGGGPLAAGFPLRVTRAGQSPGDGALGGSKTHNEHLPLRCFIVIHRPPYRVHNAAG